MWPPRLQAEPFAQWRGQVSDVPAVQHELLVGVEGGVDIQFLILCMSTKRNESQAREQRSDRMANGRRDF